MNGWLVINSFIGLSKFKDIYKFLQISAKAEGIKLEIIPSDFLLSEIQNNFKNYLLPDFVIFWDKDVLLAKRLEHIGLKVFNSAKAIEICDNKILTSMLLSNNNIPMPRTIPAPKTFEAYGYNNTDFIDNAINILGLPIIIKEAYGSFGMQVYLAKSRDEAKKIVTEIIKDKEFLFQEFIQESYGKDIRINVVNGQVIASMKRYNNNDFRSNITIGGNMECYTPTEAEKQIAINATNALGLDFAGVDVLFGSNGPLICEVNSNPHFKTTLMCTGIDISVDIIKHIKSKITEI